MDEEELKQQRKDFNRIVRCNQLAANQNQLANNQRKHDRLKRQYIKRKYETVLGIKLDDIPPFEFPKDNILRGFGTNRKD